MISEGVGQLSSAKGRKQEEDVNTGKLLSETHEKSDEKQHTQQQWFPWLYSPINLNRQMRKIDMLQSNICTYVSQVLFN